MWNPGELDIPHCNLSRSLEVEGKSVKHFQLSKTLDFLELCKIIKMDEKSIKSCLQHLLGA